MIESLYQIDFITASGTLRLLDIGAIVDSEPQIAWKQREQSYAPIGAEWSEKQALGGAENEVTWQAIVNHASQAALRGYCLRHTATLPSGQTGTLRLTISGGDVWDIEDAVLSSSKPLPLTSSGSFETVTAYTASGGRMVPGAAIALYAGIPWIFILQDWDALTGDWDTL
jgi:hypothetical protein